LTDTQQTMLQTFYQQHILYDYFIATSYITNT